MQYHLSGAGRDRTQKHYRFFETTRCWAHTLMLASLRRRLDTGSSALFQEHSQEHCGRTAFPVVRTKMVRDQDRWRPFCSFEGGNPMKDVIGFFTGHNIYAWLFIIACCVGLGAVSIHQKKQAEADQGG
jgi:hypothetical protein